MTSSWFLIPRHPHILLQLVRVSVAIVATVLDYSFIYYLSIYLWFILVIHGIWRLAVGESIKSNIKVVFEDCLWSVWDKPTNLIFACICWGNPREMWSGLLVLGREDK